MHVAFVSDQYPPYPVGGVGARVTDLARGLVEAGHMVTVAGVYPRNRGLGKIVDEMIDGVRVVRLPPAPAWMRWRPGILWERHSLSARLRKLHAEAPFDLVEFTDGFGWALFGGPRGVPVAVRIEGTTKLFDEAMGVKGEPFIYGLEEKGLKRADCLSALSHYAKRETLRVFGMENRECTVIYNAVDTDLFRPGMGPAEAGLIVFANSVEPRKGAQEMVMAMNYLCGDFPHARLVLIGSDTQPVENGRRYSERVMDAVRPEYRGRITFAGRVDRVPGVLDYLRKAAVCCYPSKIETFGVAPLEAMAVGKPVVYYNAGPGPELIEDGVSGFLCDCDSAEAIAEKIRFLLANPAMAEAMGRRARERAVAMFDKRDWVRRNIDYYMASIKKFEKQAGLI